MNVTFSTELNSTGITPSEFNDFQNLVGLTFPDDYRQHMLVYNGGIINERVMHKGYPDGGGRIDYFYPIKYGTETMESIHAAIGDTLPSGYISIGCTKGGGEIILSLNSDNYGFLKECFTDNSTNELSPSFIDLLNDMILDENSY